MNTLFNRPLDDIDESDLKNLIDIRKVREYVSLDYKLTSYEHNHDGVVKLLTDITAMSNSRGGNIIIGVEEDSDAADGTPKSLVGIDNGDDEANWIQTICLTSIDETIVGLLVRDIQLSNKKHCVIIQIPNSIKKPHMVAHEKHRSFRIRHGRSNAIMDMAQVRDMVESMASYHESLQSFIQERVRANKDIANKDPFLLIMATPIYLGTEKLDPLQIEYRDLLEQADGVPDNHYEGIKVGKSSPRIYGIELTQPFRSGGKYQQYSRLFRNGHLEYYENYSPGPIEDWPKNPMPIYSYRIAVTLLHFLKITSQVYKIAEIADPISICLFLGNADPSYILYHPKHRHYLDDPYIWKDKNLLIDTTINDIDKSNSIASNILDRLFNAYGYDKNRHFSDAKEFIIPN
jgi:hypothetical protein